MLSSTYAGSRRLRTTTLAVSAAAVLALALAGCGGGTPDGAASGSPSASASSGDSAGASSSTSPSASASSTSIPKPKVVDGTITATDDSFSLQVPSGWAAPERGVPEPFVVSVQDGTDQIAVSKYPGAADAAETAQQSVGQLTAQGVRCETTTIGDRSAIDCTYDYQGKPVHKMFFPLQHDGSSALLLFQTVAGTRDDAYARLAPILATWRWADGSELARG